MCERDIKIIVNVPRNADKVLFAEDLVNYALDHFNLPRVPSTMEMHRNRIRNAFNETIRVAVNYLYKRLERESNEDFEYICIAESVDTNSFLNYVSFIEEEVMTDGFEAQKLLHFCVKTVMMAIKFRYSEVNQCPALAAQRIANALESFDMRSGGWDILNNTAESYASLYADIDENSDSESENETTNASNCELSDASDLKTTPSQVKGSKNVNRLKCPAFALDSQKSSEPELIEAPSCEIMNDDEICGGNELNIERVVLCLPMDDECLETNISTSCDSQKSSESEAKPEEAERVSASSNSVYFDTDEEWNSDVFEDDVNMEVSSDCLGRRSGRKRTASRSSTTSGFHAQSSKKNSHAPSATNSSSQEPTCNVETSNIPLPPIRKRKSKSRKKL